MMSILTATEFDDCRSWIKRKRNKNVSWDMLKLACKTDIKGLKKFLKNKIEEDDWPEQLDSVLWGKLVTEMEEVEKNKMEMEKENRKAELHDGRQENNQVYVPKDAKSSWQLYKRHLKESKHFSDDAIQKIEDASLGILKRLSINTVDMGPVKGLVIGNVQSGKTANMAGLMAMAADWGWNLFIVLSGTIENLRKQTQNRLHSDLNHPGNRVWIQFDHLSKKKSPIGQRLCDLQLQKDSPMRYMTVCLKIKSRLEDLIEWIEADQQNIKNLKVLVIDDEADQAGVNTGDVYSESDRKTINRLILNLVHCRDKKAISNTSNKYRSHYQAMNYISYTATPYANCLNEIGEETLYPKNFIRTLDITKSYFGPDKIFEVADADDNGHLDIVRKVSDADMKVIRGIQKGTENTIPRSLRNAVLWFICAASAMRYYDYKKPVSMLVHTSQKQTDHKALAEAIKRWINNNKNMISDKCRDLYHKEKKALTRRTLRQVYPDYEHSDEEIWDYPEYEDIEYYVEELIDRVSSIMMDDEGELCYNRGIHLCIDNCSNNGLTEDGMHMRLAYPDERGENKPDFATAFIVVGGNTLSRGLTLEGLVSTFFLRSVGQADTLMQMGRWFGYRPGYELFPRIWLTEDTITKFEYLSDIDKDLREQIYQMQLAGKGPEDFNLTLMTSPKVSWMSLTSKKKMQLAVDAEVDFSGMDTQLTVYSKKSSDQLGNIAAAEYFISTLGKGRKSSNTEAWIWENIPFGRIKEDFFERGFEVPETSKAFQKIDLLNEWIQEQTKKGEMLDWNILLCGVKRTDKDKIWNLSKDLSIGKINRSCKTDSDDRVNIGVLSGKKDYVADITEEMLGNSVWNEMITSKNLSSTYRDYRVKAKVEKVPLFLIYMIDKNSRPSKERSNRTSLSMEHDLIGITMVIPGIRGEHRSKVKRVKIGTMETGQEVEE